MNLRRDDGLTGELALSGLLEILVGIPELGLPLLGIFLVLAVAAAPFYVVYHASRAFAPAAEATPALAADDIRWVLEPPARALEVACPYCGSRDPEPMRTCPCCDVPHHAACWDENRGCTVYACAGTRAQALPMNRSWGRSRRQAASS